MVTKQTICKKYIGPCQSPCQVEEMKRKQENDHRDRIEMTKEQKKETHTQITRKGSQFMNRKQKLERTTDRLHKV